MTVEDKVIQILRTLPNVRQQELLDFAEFLQTRTEISKTLIYHEPRLVPKGSAWVIETPPIGSVDDINQFLNDLREERIGDRCSGLGGSDRHR